MWPYVSIIFAASAFCFVSAFFPHWPVKWGSNRYKKSNKPPMSVAGRVGFGISLSIIGIGMLLGNANRSLTGVLTALFIINFIGMIFIFFRDWEEDPNREP